MMIPVKTKTGFACEINDAVMDDVEVLDFLVDIEDGDTRKYPRLVAKIFTPEAKRALYDHVRTEDGRVPYAALSAELTDVFNAIRDGKN